MSFGKWFYLAPSGEEQQDAITKYVSGKLCSLYMEFNFEYFQGILSLVTYAKVIAKIYPQKMCCLVISMY